MGKNKTQNFPDFPEEKQQPMKPIPPKKIQQPVKEAPVKLPIPVKK